MAAVMGMDEMPAAFWSSVRAPEVGRLKPEGVGIEKPFTLDILNSCLGGVDPRDVLRPPLPQQQAEDMLR